MPKYMGMTSFTAFPLAVVPLSSVPILYKTMPNFPEPRGINVPIAPPNPLMVVWLTLKLFESDMKSEDCLMTVKDPDAGSIIRLLEIYLSVAPAEKTVSKSLKFFE